MNRSFRLACLLLPAVLRPAVFSAYANPAAHDNDHGLFNFVTRPDIKAPKWNITVYDREALAPGYWFFGPYETLDLKEEMGNGWIGPHIYDDYGNLIWSGAAMFHDGNIEDFRLSNVGGKELITLMDQRSARGIFMNNHYQVVQRREAAGPGYFNSHEFNFVENGTKALIVYTKGALASKKESKSVGFWGRCRVDCNGINEYDVKTWKTTFEWSSCDHITLDESTLTQLDMDDQCRGVWDYVHANSIDKTPEGDYLYSCRHSDAIYKISHKDGSIIWRLGGVKSDFTHINHMKFSRQHHIRYRGRNETHTFVSMLDNAKGIDRQEPTHDFSRGLLIALDERKNHMTAQIVSSIDHPDGKGGYSPRRGNYQPLPNGNVFMGWSEQSLQSEHASDGRMLMQARLRPDWLGTYRQYKFEFVGMPQDPPDVDVKAVDVEKHGGTDTVVHVSWNGATEVAEWKLYKTTKLGKPMHLVDTTLKTGFETKLVYNGYAQYIVVEGLNKNGSVLTHQNITSVPLPPNNTTAAVKAEHQWQKDVVSQWYEITHNPIFIATVSVVVGCAALVALYVSVRHFLKSGGSMGSKRVMDFLSRGRYAPLADEEKEEGGRSGDAMPLMAKHRASEDDRPSMEQEPFVVGGADDEDETPPPRYDHPVTASDREEHEGVEGIRER